MNFITSRKEALDVMEQYIEKDISDYTAQRNFDFGPQNRKNISCLSPYIAHKLISEYEVVKKVLNKYPFQKVEKFIQEIFWRVYWKGWLEMRPKVWTDFIEDLKIVESTDDFEKAINSSNKVAMSLSDLFCVERHKPHFLELVKNKLDITFANEQEIMSLIDVKNFDEVINFAKEIKKLIVITRGAKGSIAIEKNEVAECDSQKNLKIIDLTGAGDLFASGFLHGHINKLSTKESLEKGTTMSSKIIQKIGARLD